MSSLTEIQQKIRDLPEAEARQLLRWLAQEIERAWDSQIERDSANGKLDFLLREVEEDIGRGQTRPTDELCDDTSV